jgi:hypothetical protein
MNIEIEANAGNKGVLKDDLVVKFNPLLTPSPFLEPKDRDRKRKLEAGK